MVGAEIDTKRLVLKAFSEAMLTDEYIGWLNDLEITKYSNQRFFHHDRCRCLKYISSFEGEGKFLWAIYLKGAESGCVGSVSAHINPIHNTADIGIFIGDKCVWGNGFATEAWAAVCEFLLVEMKVSKVCGGALACNEAMIKVFERVGMVPDGRRKRHQLFEDRYVDVVHYCLFRDAKV